MNKKVRIVIFILLSFLILLNILFFYYYKSNVNVIIQCFYLYNLYSVMAFALLCFALVRVGGMFSIHTISSLFIFIFLYGRSILYIFEPNYSFFESELLVYENIGYQDMFTALVATNVFVYSINLAYILFGKPDKILLKVNLNSIRTEKILFYILIFAGILFIIKLFLEFKYILSVGYISIYVGGLDDINYYSPLIKFSHLIFYSLFSYYLIVINSKKSFLIIAFLFLFVSLLDSLKGARISLILPIFFIVWYYNSLYQIKINSKTVFKICLLITFIGFFSIYSATKRNDLELDLKTNFIKSAILETGSTLQVVGRYIKNRDQVPSTYPYFLEPIFYPYFYIRHFSVMTKGQSNDLLIYRNSLNHQFTAFLDKEGYLAGRGVGSSSPAELFQYGLFPLLFLSIIYGILLVFFYNSINNNLIIFLSSTIVLHLFFIARETPFPNMIGIIKSIFVYYILKSIFSIKLTNTKSINLK
jgi:oligosaccharide repeat unit polymerase